MRKQRGQCGFWDELHEERIIHEGEKSNSVALPMLFRSARFMEIEAEDMFWLQENTKVRMAKLDSIFSQNGDNQAPYYRVTEFLEGETLNWKNWKKPSDKKHDNIYSKIAEQVRLLRPVPSEGYYGPRFCSR
ncbi:hypothetical protein CC80DRAFT_543558 [Byssothecium circinans]|uniref:Uncharacterized protein n=1 Tax=Byssothecium circinans TaxID=147558 RepID=A0A6A5UA41_9PLEO|nr:hypothetical protein CC80DRAFT_543558 [Byssothecium circinans]